MSKKESVKILIEGEDQASQVAHEVAQKITRSLDQVKVASNQTKDSTGFVKVLVSQAGFGELGGIAGQMGQLSKEVGKFSEFAKAGESQAAAFKLGLVALAGVIGFQVGKFIGDAVFETERWKTELVEAEKAAANFNSQLLKMTQQRFGESRVEIELIADPDEKRAAYEKLISDLSKEAQGLNDKIRLQEQQIKKRDTFDEDANIFSMFGVKTESEEFLKQQQDQIKADKEQLRLIQEQSVEIRKLIGERNQEIEQKKKLNAERASDEKFLDSLRKQLELEKAIGDEKFRVQASQGTFSDESRGEAERILKEMDSIKQLREAEKQKAEEIKKGLENQAREEQKKQDILNREVSNLEQQIILLKDGAEAARVFSLEKQGLAAEDAKRLAALEMQLDKQRNVEIKSDVPNLQSIQSRVMARGDASTTPIKKTADNTEKMTAQLEKMLEELRLFNQKENPPAERIEFEGI
jgi:hypothetical protein